MKTNFRKLKIFACLAFLAIIFTSSHFAHASESQNEKSVRKFTHKKQSENNKIKQVYFIIGILEKDFDYKFSFKKPLRCSKLNLDLLKVVEVTKDGIHVDGLTEDIQNVNKNNIHLLNDWLLDLLNEEINSKSNGKLRCDFFHKNSSRNFKKCFKRINELNYDASFHGPYSVLEKGLEYANEKIESTYSKLAKNDVNETKEQNQINYQYQPGTNYPDPNQANYQYQPDANYPDPNQANYQYQPDANYPDPNLMYPQYTYAPIYCFVEPNIQNFNVYDPNNY